MVSEADGASHINGMNSWSARCVERRSAGAEGGPGKRAGRDPGTAPRSDPYTEHPTREGKLYCCVVLDAYSRRVVGWAIDSRQRADLATSALGMAIDSRGTAGQIPGGIIHGDHGTQFTSWTFTERARRAGLLPSLGTIGDPYDNAVAEAFWGRLQTELLDRQRWPTRVELANAIFEYIEGFYNRRRRHSALDWLSPVEFETTTPPSDPVSSPTCP